MWMPQLPIGCSRDPETPADAAARLCAQDLAAGYMSGKLLLKLDATAFVLQHHTPEHFAFLDEPGNSRARTAFYATLARLLFMEDTPAKFKSFVAPLQQARTATRACFGSAQVQVLCHAAAAGAHPESEPVLAPPSSKSLIAPLQQARPAVAGAYLGFHRRA
jgi:hypothetical protein